MKWFVYLLYVQGVQVPACGRSGSRDTYVGMSDDVYSRVSRHNAGDVTSTRGRKWRLRAFIGCASRADAAKMERWFKCGDTRGKRIKLAACGLDINGNSAASLEIKDAVNQWARKHPALHHGRETAAE